MGGPDWDGQQNPSVLCCCVEVPCFASLPRQLVTEVSPQPKFQC